MRTRTILSAAVLLLASVAFGPNVYPFKDGFPTPEATQKASDEADYQRAVVAYRFWYPTVSCEGIFNGHREQGFKDGESAPILAAGPRHVGFTLNSDMPYCGGVVDVKDGSYVIERSSDGRE
jgi:hypothetical protein